MNHHIEKAIKVNVSAEAIWQVMADYSSVEKYATTIDSSPIIGEISSGLGAKRKCTFNDGSSLVEEIVEFEQGKRFKMQLSEFSYPLENMDAEMRVNAIDANSCEITMSSNFVVKGSVFGWLMGFMLMRPMMKGVFKKLMTGLAYYTVTGEAIGKKLPANNELAKIVVL